MKNLKDLAIAYRLASEFDYCPSEDRYEEAVDYYGEFDKKILVEYQGNTMDEIAKMLVEEILCKKL